MDTGCHGEGTPAKMCHMLAGLKVKYSPNVRWVGVKALSHCSVGNRLNTCPILGGVRFNTCPMLDDTG